MSEGRSMWGWSSILATVLFGSFASASDQSLMEARADFAREHPRTGFLDTTDGRIHRIYGKAFAHGDTPTAAAATFISNWSHLFGVPETQIVAGGLGSSRIHEQPIYYERDTDTYRFTGVYHMQSIEGVPVFGSRLLVLVRNQPDFPAVLIGADLKPLGDWRPDVHPAIPDNAVALRAAEKFLGAPAELAAAPTWFIFAGGEGEVLAPRLVMSVEATAGSKADGTYRRWLLLIDAQTEAVLYEENRVLNCLPAGTVSALSAASMGDISGTVAGYMTSGSGAAECDPPVLQGLSYARITTSEGNFAFTDVDGNYVVETDPGEELELTSEVRGLWFRVQNQNGENAIEITTAVHGSTEDILHNPNIDEEYVLAQVNGYQASNDIRDFVLEYNPEFPEIISQFDYPVNVNINDSCNAYFDYSSINFYLSSGGCSNTAFSSVVYHEYGHNLVDCAGSGQGEYGEGMGDVMSVLLTGDSHMARGFFLGQCESGIRNADNNCMYQVGNCSSCGSGVHDCGKLLSGCVWDVRANLMSTLPHPAGSEIANNLIINSMLLHNGTGIGESIVIDFLTLDDVDADIGNGTPHYQSIADGFGEHDIDAPALDFLNFTFPDGLPEVVDPNGGTTLKLFIESNLSELEPGSEQIWIDMGFGFQLVDLEVEEDGSCEATFPAAECSVLVRYVFHALTTDGTFVYSPSNWPNSFYSAYAAYGVDIAIDDNFQTDQGWSVTGTSSTPWTRRVPTGGPSWKPETDYDGSGFCYVVDNPELDGTTILTSPSIDAGGGGALEFAYWLAQRNNNPAQPEDGLQLYVSTDGDGAEWTLVRDWHTYDNQWRIDELSIGPEGEVPTSESLYLRFVAIDEDKDNRVFAGIDAVEMISVDCESPPCTGDLVEDGQINVNDLLVVIAAWGSQGGDADGNGTTNVDDLLIIIQSWGPCT